MLLSQDLDHELHCHAAYARVQPGEERLGEQEDVEHHLELLLLVF